MLHCTPFEEFAPHLLSSIVSLSPPVLPNSVIVKICSQSQSGLQYLEDKWFSVILGSEQVPGENLSNYDPMDILRKRYYRMNHSMYFSQNSSQNLEFHILSFLSFIPQLLETSMKPLLSWLVGYILVSYFEESISLRFLKQVWSPAWVGWWG